MYQKAVVTFIDILGFKEILSKGCAEVASTLSKFEKLNREYSAYDGSPKIIKFSDSIVRIRPLNEDMKTRCTLVFSELNALVLIQGELINKGICVRGGVSIGDVYCEDTTVFGPGLVKAYEMESIYANYPRIVIDLKLICQLNEDLSSDKTLVQHKSDFRNMIRKGSDGLYFIDYLKAFLNELDDLQNSSTFLNCHKKLITNNIRDQSKLSPVLAKYLWMAMYHNEVVEELRIKQEKGLVISSKADDCPLLLYI